MPSPDLKFAYWCLELGLLSLQNCEKYISVKSDSVCGILAEQPKQTRISEYSFESVNQGTLLKESSEIHFPLSFVCAVHRLEDGLFPVEI